MILARKAAAAVLLGMGGGVVCGAAISLVATFYGPHGTAVDSVAPGILFRLAVAQGSLVGALIGAILGPLAYLALERHVTASRIGLGTATGTLVLGALVGLAGGPAAGLAGGVLGFFVAVVVLSPTSMESRTRVSI
jgi:hypothetical protein